VWSNALLVINKYIKKDNEKVKIMSSKIIRCTCAHEFQDGLYGVGNRMANELRNGQFSCTVCGNVVGSSQSIHQAPKAKEPEKEVVKEKVVKEKDVKKSPDKKKEENKRERKPSMKGGKR
jgi:hypothetical protein